MNQTPEKPAAETKPRNKESNGADGAPEVNTASDSLPAALTAEEISDLQKCEAVITHGWATFVEVGRALAHIRDRRLYRGTHKTFEQYCRESHEMSKTHANRLISAAQVVDCLTPIGVKIENEAQARPKLRQDFQRLFGILGLHGLFRLGD